MKKHKWAAAFTACLLAFTVYISLDTFVLSSAYQTDATEINLSSIKSAVKTDTVPEAVSAQDDGNKTADDGNGAADDSGSAESSPSPAGPGKAEKTGDQSDGSSQNTDVQSDGSSKNTDVQPDGSSSESSRHRKKPGEGHGGPGGEHGDGQGGGHGSGKGGNSSTASTTTIKNFDEEEALASAAEVTTDNSGSSQDYEDGNIKITYTQYTTNDTTIHVADVQLSSAEYLKTAFADNTYGKNVTQTTSDIAAANNAVLAINGDYYGVQEKGYVIRNGVLYREAAADNDVLCIYGDGSMKVVDPSSVTAQELLDQGAWQAFSFGPGLLEDGSIPISLDTEVGRAKASNPRTAIGIIDDLHYVFVVSDGRSDESEGLSLFELAVFMQELGVKTAYNLDGGGSSTMYFNGNVVNNPTSGFRDDERKVSDIIYIG